MAVKVTYTGKADLYYLKDKKTGKRTVTLPRGEPVEVSDDVAADLRDRVARSQRAAKAGKQDAVFTFESTSATGARGASEGTK